MTVAHGLDASQYTFNYVAGWAHDAATPDGPSVEEIVKATGQRVIGATDRILQATQPSASLVEDAMTDLTVDVSRPLENVRVADRPATPSRTRTTPGSVRPIRERVDAPSLDGAARQRAALPRPAVPAHSISR